MPNFELLRERLLVTTRMSVEAEVLRHPLFSILSHLKVGMGAKSRTDLGKRFCSLKTEVTLPRSLPPFSRKAVGLACCFAVRRLKKRYNDGASCKEETGAECLTQRRSSRRRSS